MKASLINIRLTSRYFAGSYILRFRCQRILCIIFRCSRSGQVHKFMAALFCLRSVETNLTPTCPSPKLFVCNLPDSGRQVTRVFQGLSLSRSVGWVGENPGNEVVVLDSLSVWLCHPMLSSIRIPSDLVVETCFIGILSSDSPKGFR